MAREPIKCKLLFPLNKKTSNFTLKVSRGIERIRTAVAAFAELSLATRPRCPIRLANVKK